MSPSELFTPDPLAQLGATAADIAMTAAIRYVRLHNLAIPDYDAAAACVGRHIEARLKEAMEDAREAFDVGLDQIGEDTFVTSMRLAGVEAAKEFTGPQ